MRTMALVLTAALLVVACVLSLGLLAENATLKDRNRRLEDQNSLLTRLVSDSMRAATMSLGVAEYGDEVMRRFLRSKGLAPNLERLP